MTTDAINREFVDWLKHAIRTRGTSGPCRCRYCRVVRVVSRRVNCMQHQRRPD